ncbi:molecular chaperone HtpG [Thiorhodospira sibirica]|uniref:molecular chaperone HtpG n=1 Tax=Thiorhodospira sibirica TaxID=154347 RepID=UPI00022C1125|nr:molecular chaperone HtpG [Thiorhodospira sibirica]
MSVDAHKETLRFQTEVSQLLHLMIHALYSNKEIFLRELISNAADACDKLRFESLADDALLEGQSQMHIEVSFDPTARTITICDNGIGMSREEVIQNIGTIAKSGTREFLSRLSGDQKQDAHMIGQFGVGFYSSFIVAQKVTLSTRRAGMGAEHGVRWESDGSGDFSVETIERAARGTEIVLHLKEGEDEFLDAWRLRHIITRYSDHIPLPIMMPAQRHGDEADEQSNAPEWETVNRASALWTRAKSEISDEEYREFYKHVAHDFEDPLSWLHNRVEGKQEYTTLFYIPARAPFDLWDRDTRKGIKLYVQRVFIMDEAEHLMPAYLRFVRGVVDSNDLPLNISREILQNNRLIDSIRGGSVKKVLAHLQDMAEQNPEKYQGFWDAFGRVLKEGPAEDYSNREAIAKLLRFASTHSDSEQQTVSLADYIARMKEGQKAIYYITAESHAAARHSPHLETFRKHGLEVLLLSDRVDEWLVSHLHDFEGKSLQSVAKGALDLGDLESEDEKQAAKAAEEEAKDVLVRLKEVLGERVEDVRVSHRLVDSPACIVLSEQDMALYMQQLLKQAGHQIGGNKPILEVNPRHRFVERLRAESDSERFKEWGLVLFEQAVLAEGGQLEDPAQFVRRLNQLIF